MKYLLAQPANTKFKWELDVVLTNIRSMDTKTPILLLFLEEDFTVPLYFEDRYPSLEIYTYTDRREIRTYLPAIRPYLCYQHFKAHSSAENEDYFQLDSDIIFRQLPDFSQMPLDKKVCWASDCHGYIDYEYLSTRKEGQRIIEYFAKILNISEDIIKNTPGGGAQWLISKPTEQLWYHIWKDSDILYEFLSAIPSDIQGWTAEMWAQLYNLVKFGWEIKLSPELDFIRPTDDIALWSGVNILHNAGVLADQSHRLFFKGTYIGRTPFRDNFSFVDPTKASSKYVEAIKKVAH